MKLAFTQPYFFPYLGIYSLAYAADNFVVFDTAQYRRRSWMSRNRVYNRDKGFAYINLAVENDDFKCSISDVLVDNKSAWQETLVNKLNVYSNLPRYKTVLDLIKEIIYSGAKSLTEMDMLSISYIMDYLGLDFNYSLISKVDIDFSASVEPGDNSFIVAKSLGADTYINMPSGSGIYVEEKFIAHGIELRFLSHSLPEYKQGDCIDFIAGLSVIDALMFLPKEKVRDMITSSFCLKTKAEMQ